MEAKSLASATRGPATALASGAWGVGMDAVVVIRHICRGRVGRFRYNGWISLLGCRILFCGDVLQVFGLCIFAVVRATAGAVHRSRVVCQREAVGVRGG